MYLKEYGIIEALIGGRAIAKALKGLSPYKSGARINLGAVFICGLSSIIK